jgi:hypothetical protein
LSATNRKTGRWFWRPSPAGSKAKGKWTLTIDGKQYEAARAGIDISRMPPMIDVTPASKSERVA